MINSNTRITINVKILIDPVISITAESMRNIVGIMIASLNFPLYKCPKPGVIKERRAERIALLLLMVKFSFSVCIVLPCKDKVSLYFQGNNIFMIPVIE